MVLALLGQLDKMLESTLQWMSIPSRGGEGWGGGGGGGGEDNNLPCHFLPQKNNGVKSSEL